MCARYVGWRTDRISFRSRREGDGEQVYHQARACLPACLRLNLRAEGVRIMHSFHPAGRARGVSIYSACVCGFLDGFCNAARAMGGVAMYIVDGLEPGNLGPWNWEREGVRVMNVC